VDGDHLILDDTGASLDHRSFRAIVSCVTASAVLSIVAVIATRRFLYADSSYFLLRMWESGSFFVPNPSRWFAFGVSQWLPVTAMKLGSRDPAAIATLYGANLWLNPLLAVLIAWWTSERSREVTLLVLLGVLFLFQSTYIVLDNESNIFFLLASILFILTLRRDFSYGALALLVPIAFTHEVAALAFSPVLAVLLFRKESYERYYGARRFWSLVTGLAAVVGLVAWHALAPDAGPNRTYFLQGALSLPASPSLVLTTLAFGSLLADALRPGLRGLNAVFWASTTMLLLLPFALPGVLWPFYHYRARILNAVLALLLFLYLHGRTHWRLPSAAALGTRRVLCLATVVFLFQGKVTWEWARHAELFRSELGEARGIVEFPSDGRFSDPRSRQFSWSWTSPVRSIAFQAMAHEEVRAIMLNADTTLWQPFNPRVRAQLPDLSALGISYDLEDP
jgi:hypothetical protein